MYLSDKNALKYGSGLVLVGLPVILSVWNAWSWAAEILLLFAVFWHAANVNIKVTTVLMAAGYLAALIIDRGVLGQIGFAPWAGILLSFSEQKKLPLRQSMFFSLMAVAVISALPMIPVAREAIQPENVEATVTAIIQTAQQQGLFSSFEAQGLSVDYFKGYLETAVPVFYKLIPGMTGILGMAELGLVYLVIRITQKKDRPLPPVSLWGMPWYAVWVAILGLAAFLGGNHFKIDLLQSIGFNLMAIIAAVAFVVGFSCIAYLLKHWKVPRWFIWLIIISLFFYPYYLATSILMYIIIGFVFVGLFDFVFNFRRIPEKVEEGKQ